MGRDLARAYRPLKLSAVVGQETPKALLQGRLDRGEPAQAWIFQGPPGTGKTTMARLVAMGLNCKEGPTSEPCGECPSCKAILGGRSEWVYELNAGANGGIDTLREVIDELRRPVPNTAWRVLILDECQAMTQAAQTALLKPLEEPPNRTVMVLATTHPSGIQQAIRSRCEPIVFKALAEGELVSLLEAVADAEGLKLKPATIAAIADKASGSPRNALKNLALAAEDESTFELQGQQQLDLLAARTLRRLAEGDLAQALEAGVQLTRSCASEHGAGAAALQVMAEQIYNVISVQALGLQADELNVGEETWASLRKAADGTDAGRLGAWADLVWEAWGKADSALLRVEALVGLTVSRMLKATGVPTSGPAQSAPAAPAKVSSKPKTPAVPTSGPLTQESMVAAAAQNLNVQGLLQKASLVGLEDGLLTLRCSSFGTRSRLKKLSGDVVELLASVGVREMEVVS